MKSIFQKPVCKKEYHVVTETWSISRWFNSRYCPEIFPFNGEPAIYIRNKFIEYINILETNKFIDKFSKDDKVCIENKIYNIVDVIYGIDTYIYRLKEYELIDDEQSKEEAMKEYEKKVDEQNKKEKELIEKEVTQMVDNLEPEINNKQNKKWWQFWR